MCPRDRLLKMFCTEIITERNVPTSRATGNAVNVSLELRERHYLGKADDKKSEGAVYVLHP